MKITILTNSDFYIESQTSVTCEAALFEERCRPKFEINLVNFDDSSLLWRRAAIIAQTGN